MACGVPVPVHVFAGMHSCDSKRVVFVSRVITVAFGLLAIAVAIVAQYLGKSLSLIVSVVQALCKFLDLLPLSSLFPYFYCFLF